MTISFQDAILKLTHFWIKKGCIHLQGYDLEVGAGTLHPSTALRALREKKWNVCYVQSSRRPKDGRYGENPNRLQSHLQMQVILKPSPDNLQELYLDSLREIGVDIDNHDVRFVEDDWENPSIGASGLGYEVWLDGMEVSQFTYMQQIGGIECDPIPGELTYGLERLMMYIQRKDNVYDLSWNNDGVSYGDVYLQNEQELSAYALDFADTDNLLKSFSFAESECLKLVENNLPLAAYEQCLKASHILNLLEARGKISVTERALYLKRVRHLAKSSMELYVKKGTGGLS